MRSNKTQVIASMNTRQKITAAVLVIVVIVVIWQVIGMFGGSKPSVPATPKMESQATAMKGGAPNATPPQEVAPQQADLIKQQQAQTPTPRETQLMMLQQETQAKYIAALNELQMLKISREIAETNQAIATAKLATIKAEKNIVTMLSPTPVTTTQYSHGLVNPVSSGNVIRSPGTSPQTVAPQEVNYSVISVSQLQYRWGAVIGYQGNLYNVHIGDQLPPDGSIVLSIDKSGVMIEKDGVKRKLSLVPII